MTVFGLKETDVANHMRAISPDNLTNDHLFERFARAAWSFIAEPGDRIAGEVCDRLGACGALDALIARRDPDTLAIDLDGQATAAELDEALRRWQPRLQSQAILRGIAQASRFGVQLVTPHDDSWPVALDDLGPFGPRALWVRGRLDTLATANRSIALVGARAATGYGEHVTMEASAGLVDRGYTIVSGAAYGIDGMAHRTALASHGETIAILAGGVDRFYPSGHEALLNRIVADGVVISEVPCGTSPTKWRFLQRNRLIATMSLATIVLEQDGGQARSTPPTTLSPSAGPSVRCPVPSRAPPPPDATASSARTAQCSSPPQQRWPNSHPCQRRVHSNRTTASPRHPPATPRPTPTACASSTPSVSAAAAPQTTSPHAPGSPSPSCNRCLAAYSSKAPSPNAAPDGLQHPRNDPESRGETRARAEHELCYLSITCLRERVTQMSGARPPMLLLVGMSAAALVLGGAGGYIGASLAPTALTSITGSPGADGREGPQGQPGPAGPAGADGSTGPIGPAGAPGVAGRNGAPGAKGEQGAPGANGLDGAPGAPGTPGVDGAPGANGTNGAAGANGLTSLIRLTTEAAGPNCPAGGTRIEHGVDADSNGTLEAAEVQGTPHYICNGADAATNLPAARFMPLQIVDGAILNCEPVVTTFIHCINPRINGLPVIGASIYGSGNADALCDHAIGTSWFDVGYSLPAHGDYAHWNGSQWVTITGDQQAISDFACRAP